MAEYTEIGRVGSTPDPTSSYGPEALLNDVMWLVARRGLSPALAARDLTEARSVCARLLVLLEVHPTTEHRDAGQAAVRQAHHRRPDGRPTDPDAPPLWLTEPPFSTGTQVNPCE